MRASVVAIISLLAVGLGGEAVAKMKCSMEFQLKSWSAFYKSGKGTGDVTCEDGKKARVTIRTHGGGITFGKNNIIGHGEFKNVEKIQDIYGSYASAGAHAGAVKSAQAQTLSKDDIDLDISGHGTGVDLGFDFGSFKVSPRGK
jgi:hypothetical protein